MPWELDLVDWRRQVFELYAAVRAQDRPEDAHSLWRARRDALFRHHPQSPLPSSSPLRATGLSYWPYDPALRFEVALRPSRTEQRVSVPTGPGETTVLRSAGSVDLPAPVGAVLEVWWLEQYGGGLFLPLRDGTAGTTSYGGGRYLLDTAKGADLGSSAGALNVDLNFLYHPSCRYDSEWQCPLAPAQNSIGTPMRSGERL
jgi:uncharacterized protein (DUF1684 family)